MATRQLYIVIMIYCMSDFKKSHATALDANRTCACTYPCDFSQVCSPTPNCIRENAALGKSADISSMYPDSGPACLVVNGNTGTKYIPTTNGQTPNCVHTGIGTQDTNAWWQVNLGRAYTVTNISVFIRGGFASRLDGVSITVDGQDCYTFLSGTADSPVQKQIWCTTPRRGSLVKFSRNGLLNICGVQVWVCKDGFFGKDCNETCSSKCRNDLICDNFYGNCLPDGACYCSSGCNFTHSCIPMDNCREENVALGKPARISSNYSDGNGPAGPACVAVNGNTGTTYMPDTQGGHPNCIQTGLNDQNTWWEVDLGRVYTITDITVYIRESLPERMDNVKITVDGKDCYTFPTRTTSSPPNKDISCLTPLQGRIVRLSKTAGLLNFCEVQVWVCKPGLYGEDCDFKCNCRNNETCDNYHGSCLEGCSPGYYGFNCTQKCGRCKDNSACNSTNGNCMSGCQTGWEEPLCEKCSEIFYGYNCSQRCGNCKDASYCNASTGHCLSGCKEGWLEPMCAVCKSGFYGANCNQTCGNCRNSPCNAFNGVCLGGCQDGYETQFCNETCRNKTYGRNCSLQCGRCNNSTPCDVFNGSCTACKSNFKSSMCTECILGYYGEECNIPCGHCKNGKMCNNTDGVCPDGCEDGYEFPLCNQTGCSNRMYGPNCSIECGHCLEGGSCNATNGACPDGCDAGYNTTLCNEKCSFGTWGRNCKNVCGACLWSTCRHDNGICEKGCFSGYEGEDCTVLLQQTNDRDLTGVIAGSVAGAGLLIGCSIVTAVLIWLRRSTLKDKRCPQPLIEDRETHDSSNDGLAMENVNFYENAYDKLETQEDVAKPYEMLGKETHVDDVMQSQL